MKSLAWVRLAHPVELLREGEMDVLVMLEDGPIESPVLARVDSVPAMVSTDHRAREVVTLYGTPNTESLALALAAAVESHRSPGNGSGAFRHVGIWSERGAVGDAAWRDEITGELLTRDVDIPFAVLNETAVRLKETCGLMMGRLVAGLAMPDWPEGTWRAISFRLDAMMDAASPEADEILQVLREADGLAYEYEGD
ncbi:MAG: hypothetical protein ACT4PJ_01970 [Gemmatimonadaceae bacterium]